MAKADAAVFRPEKELKGFAKVFLQAGECKTVTIPLDDKAFRYWNVKTDRWETEGGSYQLLVGASVQDIRLRAEVSVQGTGAPDPYAGKAVQCYRTADIKNVPDAAFEALLGHAEVRQTYKVSGVGTVAGCYVQDGKLQRKDCQVRLVRDGIVIHEGVLASLQRFKDSVKEVQSGYECGLSIEKFNDIKEGDIVEAFTMEQIEV